MVCNKKPPAALRLPVALLALAIASAVVADDPDTGREQIPPYVAKRADLLIHEPTGSPPVPAQAAGRNRERTAPVGPGE
jgi:hypothetical protein